MAEENASPISAAKPPVSNPMASATSAHAATLKLKPIIRKPVAGATSVPRPGIKLPTPAAAEKPAAEVRSAAVDQLKNITQRLKGVTQQIPQQAILHKTGIIADQALTEAQKQASKSRTARISLSDAMGVAPVNDEAAPMKTIRIKRPSDVKNPAAAAPKPPAPAPKPAPAAVAPAPTPVPEPAPEPTPADVSVTQRKTLKVSRPGGRPPTKFGLKKPGAAAPAADGAVEDIPEVADIPEMPAGAAAVPSVQGCPPDRIPDVGKVAQVLGLLAQVAACAAMGFLVWQLYEVAQLDAHCGGLVFMR